MKDPTNRIPTKLILEFLDIKPTDEMVSKVNKIRRQIEEVIYAAKQHFKGNLFKVA